VSKTVRHLLIAIVIFSICGAYFVFFGYQTLMVLETRYLSWKVPFTKKTPVPLANTAVSSAPGTKLSFFGYEFEVPWEDVDASRTKRVNNMASIFFRSGNAMVISSVPPRDFVRSLMSSGGLDDESFRRIYGDEALRSDYLLKRSIFENTPDKVTLLTQKPTIASRSMMLMTKATIAPEKDSEIYSVRCNGFEGFQLGNPADRPATIALELYADDGELEFVLMQRKQGPPSSISQADINRILQSIRRVDADHGRQVN